jgi:hypothetical protein
MAWIEVAMIIVAVAVSLVFAAFLVEASSRRSHRARPGRNRLG